MDKSHFALSQNQLFLREFLTAYKKQLCLWKKDDPNYRNGKARSKAYDTLVTKAKEFYEEADTDFVRVKLDSLRTAFRRERRKVIRSKELSCNPDELYKPSLWYYDLLLFTCGEETDEEMRQENLAMKIQPNPKEVRVPYWGRDYTALLIKLYKNHPCLYSTTHPCYKNNKKRAIAIKDITQKLMQATGKNFDSLDVKKKISLFRGQFLYEFKKKINNHKYEPRLWAYEMLEFLEKEYLQQPTALSKKKQKNIKQSSISEDSEEDNIKIETNSSISFESCQEENSFVDSALNDQSEDIYDTIARNLVHQLNDMTNHQRTIANKLIHEVLQNAKTGQLTENSRFNLNN